jgi:hypothetical protein
MSGENMDERLLRLSEGLFGEPAEIETAEAEELLKAAGIDPARLQESFHQRFHDERERYRKAGHPVPPLLEKALADLRSRAEQEPEESAESRTARRTIARLLQEIAKLPDRLNAGFQPAFTAAYRNRTELSDRDKMTLDRITADLKKKTHA